MDIKELFLNLSLGELSSLSMAMECEEGIRESDQQKVLVYVNEALLRLHTRFVLRKDELIVQQLGYLTTYELKSEYAATNMPVGGNPDLFYIKDVAVKPFKDDIIKINAVANENNQHLPLNDRNWLSSVFTPSPTVLQIPYPIDKAPLSITYQARHPKLTLDDLSAEVNLPAVLEGALYAYVAYKAFSHIGTQEMSGKAVEFLQLYERICQEVLDRDPISESIAPTDVKFYLGGWV